MPEQEPLTIELKDIKEWSFTDFLNFAVMQSLKSASEDIVKYAISVDNIETLLIDDLENDKSNPNYFQKIKTKEKELEREYGTRDEFKAVRLKELSSFKFRELIKFIKKKTPQEVIGVLK